jgi:hypothetical protein
MNTKEKIRAELDQLSDDVLDDILKYLHSMKNSRKTRKKYDLNLKRKFEDRVLREDESSDIQGELNSFQEFLLNAPVMTDEDFNFFLEKKQSFNKWE